ncbi:MAG: GNAT family N-acetyltransferase [Candidatus Bipolaricaulota bacterium]
MVIAPPRKYLVSGIHRRDAEVAEKFPQEGSFDSGSGIQSQNRFSLRSLRLRGKQIPPEIQGSGAGHWKVVLLGVRPAWRGRGVGSSLMDRAHALCDRDPDARGVYLSTHGRRNRSFYERLGYKVIGQIRLGRLELYRMARPRA